MKQSFDVLDIIYPIINVAKVKATLDGRVYRHSKPLDSKKRDVVILSLPIVLGRDKDIQQVVVIINCYCPNILPGMPDEINLKSVSSAVLAALDGYVSGDVYCNIDVASQATMSDSDQTDMTYVSIRCNVSVQY